MLILEKQPKLNEEALCARIAYMHEIGYSYKEIAKSIIKHPPTNPEEENRGALNETRCSR